MWSAKHGFIALENGAGRVIRPMLVDPFKNSLLRSLLKQDSIHRSRSPVWELVAAFHTSRCADARDHVYALLPLAEDGPATSHINFDYTKSPSILFTEVMAPLVEMRTRGQPRVSSEEEWQDDMLREPDPFLQIASRVKIALGLPIEDLEVLEVLSKLVTGEVNNEFMKQVQLDQILVSDADSQQARNDLDTWDDHGEYLE